MTCEQKNENNSPPLLPSGLARGGREHLQQVDGSGGKAGKVPLWQVSSSASSVSSGTETKTRLRRFRIRTSLTHSGGEWALSRSPPTHPINFIRKKNIHQPRKHGFESVAHWICKSQTRRLRCQAWYLRRASHPESRPTGLTRCVTPPRLACLQNVNLQPLHQQVCLRTDDMQNFYHRKDVFRIGKAVSQEDSGWRILQWAECN